MPKSLTPFANLNFDEAVVVAPDVALGSVIDFTQFVDAADATDERGGMVMLVRANGAVDANDLVVIDSAYDAAATTLVNTAAAFGQLCGIARIGAADNEFFFADIYGKSKVNALTLAAKNVAINSTATAGTIDDDATAGAEIITGLVLLDTVGGSTAATACHLAFPIIGATAV